MPYQWLDIENDAEARALVEATSPGGKQLPVVFFPDGSALAQPRMLGPAELTALAGAMAQVVRERGPYLSLGAFVNPPQPGPGNPDGAALAALDEAIRRAGINAAYREAATQPPPGTAWFSAAAASAPLAEGMPGYLTQGDILQNIGSLLTVRSDTFTLRSTGEVRLLDGRLVRATCEARVQRTAWPLVHPAPGSAAAAPVSRRFVMEAFRWVSGS